MREGRGDGWLWDTVWGLQVVVPGRHVRASCPTSSFEPACCGAQHVDLDLVTRGPAAGEGPFPHPLARLVQVRGHRPAPCTFSLSKGVGRAEASWGQPPPQRQPRCTHHHQPMPLQELNGALHMQSVQCLYVGLHASGAPDRPCSLSHRKRGRRAFAPDPVSRSKKATRATTDALPPTACTLKVIQPPLMVLLVEQPV